MSDAIAFDIDRFVERLTENGFTKEQADVLALGQIGLLQNNLASESGSLGVQREIEALRHAVKADIAGVRRDIEALRLDTKTEIEGLRQTTKVDLSDAKVDLVKWLYGAMIVQGGLIVGLIKLLS